MPIEITAPKLSLQSVDLDIVSSWPATILRGIDDLLAGVDLEDDFIRGREGQVWATPLRRLLHDGGCDVFFKHWGGEAIQRLAHTASADLEAKIRSLGAPAVVTFNIPAFGCCARSDYRLAPTMLGLMLERASLIERNYEIWDVLLKRPIPTEWIESVLPNDDPSLD
jgi:hypothetical protein